MIPSPQERLQAQTVFRTSVVRLGRFSARPEDPLFSSVSPPGHHLVAFPETELAIVYERAGRFVIDPTKITCYNPDDVYQRSAISSRGDRSTWVSASPELLEELRFSLGGSTRDPDRIFPEPVGDCPSELFVKERELFRDAAQDGVDPLAVEERSIELLFEVLASLEGGRTPAPVRASPAARRSVDRALEFLAAHYRESHTANAIAQRADCSPFHLCRMFKSLTGLSMHRYRTALRLRHGFDELPLAPAGITELALDLGFSSHSHFSSRFKSEFGRTPSSVWG